MLTAPKVPCGTCPYRRDVPAGIWAETEYRKLPRYDGEMREQSQALFMCHQNDGHLCGGWLACHGPNNLLAVRVADRIHGDVDPSVYDYEPEVALFASGQEACEHGLSGIERPGPAARKKIAGIARKRGLP